jgi:hypothetical protein
MKKLLPALIFLSLLYPTVQLEGNARTFKKDLNAAIQRAFNLKDKKREKLKYNLIPIPHTTYDPKKIA